MRTTIKAALAAFGVFGAGAALAVPASAQPYESNYGAYGDPYDNGYGNNGYGPQGYQQSAYPPGTGQDGYGQDYAPDGYGDNGTCDPYYGCPDDYADLPLYYGEVYYDGGWSSGPFFYRDYGGGRQFWVHGGWHGGNIRGGHFGPALGRNFYSGRGFGAYNRGGNFGGQGYGHENGYGRQTYVRPGYARQNFQPQANAQPQSQPQSQSQAFGHNWNRGGFGAGWSRPGFQQNAQGHGGYGGGGWHGRAEQPAPQAQPQQQTARNNGGGHGDHGWRH